MIKKNPHNFHILRIISQETNILHAPSQFISSQELINSLSRTVCSNLKIETLICKTKRQIHISKHQVVGLVYSKEQWAMDWIFFCPLLTTKYLFETKLWQWWSWDSFVTMTGHDVLWWIIKYPKVWLFSWQKISSLCCYVEISVKGCQVIVLVSLRFKEALINWWKSSLLPQSCHFADPLKIWQKWSI